jgi:hypothetical protein
MSLDRREFLGAASVRERVREGVLAAFDAEVR